MLENGLIQIYTGDGKGKTTAAVGQAVRALGHGLDVCIIYFHKECEEWGYGEFDLLEEIGAKVKGFAEKHPHFFENVTQEKMCKECLKGVKYIEKIFEKDNFDMLIIDEIIISVRDGFLKEDKLLDLLDKKPEDMEVILTGRGATEKLIEKADLVSEIKKIKHPFDKGVGSREGIEF